jgi:subtilisin family serine protease
MSTDPQFPQFIVPVEPPAQFDQPELTLELIETSSFIRAGLARQRYNVDGKGHTVAVLDTGLRTTHVDFAGKVLAQRNFTSDNGGNPNDASDGNGHGTNVGGIIVANGINKGIAPGASIVPLKVLANNGGGSFTAIDNALQWVIDNHKTHRITVVNMSLGASNNPASDLAYAADPIRKKVQELTKKGIAVVIAAGNGFFEHSSQQGMSYPAIFRECVSVGAVYDANSGSFSYGSGAIAHSTGPGRITPFSQRLHERVGGVCRTDIFAPGAPITSSGIVSDTGTSIQHGTSQATPVTAGVLLLMQEYYARLRKLSTSLPPPVRRRPLVPPVETLVKWLRGGGVKITDGDDEDDNVVNTNRVFVRVDAYDALRLVRKYFVALPFPPAPASPELESSPMEDEATIM